MSTCPERDVHSVYVDGELPEKFLADYEKHVVSCPRCQKELELLRGLRDVFKEDSDAISDSFTQEKMDAGFNRLQAKLSYSKNILSFASEEKSNYRNRKRFNGLQYFVAGIAAAAAFFLYPSRLHRHQESATAGFEPIARKELVSSVKQISSRGQIVSNDLSSFAGPESYNQKVYYVPSVSSFSNVMPEGVIPLKVTETNHQFPPPPPLSSYDVFALDNHGPDTDNERPREFSFHITSPFADISVEFGK